jgi:manganese-dependent inorganic pyrophosphatase
MQNKRTVFVVGHRNPDTDSICSAIAYAELKNQTDDSMVYIPARAGQLNAETHYVLERFGVAHPTYLNNIGSRVKDLEIRHVPGITRLTSMKDAWSLMSEEGAFTLPIVTGDNRLEGIITVNDIATSYMEKQDSALLSTARTPYRNILQALDATMVVGDPNAVFDQGKVLVAAANPDVMEEYIKPHDMVIMGNRYEAQLSAIEMDAGCIVVCLGAPVSRSIQNLARDKHCAVIVSPLDTFTVARLINQSIPVEFFMKKENLMTFQYHDYCDNIREPMMKMRYRDFPILDKKKRYIGMISRRNLLAARRRAAILVDHNEVSQAVENIQDADILEIIDHHRLGSLETITPIYFRNEPVGCTATIVTRMYHERGVDIPPKIAGLLCSAILSDTLLFRSPTCTAYDRAAAESLAFIAGISCEEFALEMFQAGSDLKDKAPEEIFYQDFKKFQFGEVTFGVGQISSMSAEELSTIRTRVRPYLEKSCREHNLEMTFFMLTNIMQESTELMCYGSKVDAFVEEAFGELPKDGAIELSGVVSRKKQLIPVFMEAINKENME